MPCSVMTSNAAILTGEHCSKNKECKKELKQIEKFLKDHNDIANKHDLQNLKMLYSEDYINNDGYNKDVYFKSVEDTWNDCNDLTYTMKITKAEINGRYASVWVDETATGTVLESMDTITASGEIHSKSSGIYHLTKAGDKWLISGETLLYDESSILYGDARFMDINLQTPAQVKAGETYTATVSLNTDEENILAIGSIEKDLVTYPTTIPSGPLRAMPQSKSLERIFNANKDNINEYAVASLAISKSKGKTYENYQIYIAGLACIMKRVNVIPNNKFIKSED